MQVEAIGIKNLDGLAADGQLYEHSGDYYALEDIEEMIDTLEA